MIKASQYRRLLTLGVLLLTGFGALACRLINLQVVRHEELKARARSNTHRTVLREPRRGEIRDIRGHVLATSLPVRTVVADPSLLGSRAPEMARVLSPWLGIPEAALGQLLTPRLRGYGATHQPVYDQHVVLKHKLRVEEWQHLQQVLAASSFGLDGPRLKRSEAQLLFNLRHKAIFTEDDQVRYYPNQTLAAHVLGFAGAGGPDRALAGRDGIELAFNQRLNGVRGWRHTEKDHRGREMVAWRQQDVEARDGLNVVLTLDAGVQHILETELAEAMKKHTPVSVSGLVIRPRTGQVLAMSTLPNYDPNQPGLAPPEHRRNRVISDISEPGSTFKIVVVAGALNDHVVGLGDRFDCERGHFAYAGKVLHDHDPYGILSVESIITKSSNIGAAKIGIKLGSQPLHDYIRRFGFGQSTGISLPGEVSGIVHPLKQWSKLSLSRIPMGHEVAGTPLQMAMAMCAIANEGRLMRPLLVDRLEDAQGGVAMKFQPQFLGQVIQPAAARQMVEALKTVVGTNGTAPKARLEFYSVGGKTGTAQKAGPGGYLPGKYFSSFIGFFPADNPELCIAILLDEPRQGYYGGQTAAPFFRNVAEKSATYLNIPPDLKKELAPREMARGGDAARGAAVTEVPHRL